MTVPDWLRPLADALPHVTGEQLSRFTPPASGGRHSAVLVLFGEGPWGPDVLLIERAHTLRSHAGQPAFPGGALDPEDGDPAGDGPVVAALREAAEEVGVDATTVRITIPSASSSLRRSERSRSLNPGTTEAMSLKRASPESIARKMAPVHRRPINSIAW